MTANYRKLLLTSHIVISVGLIGTVASFLFLAVFGMLSSSPETHRVTYPAMEMLAIYIILPMASASLIIGIIQSLYSPWGLIKHYWVLAKLLLSTLTVAVLLIQLETIHTLSTIAAHDALSADDMGQQMRVLVHASGGLVVLLLATVLSVYKPRGMTRYGSKQFKRVA